MKELLITTLQRTREPMGKWIYLSTSLLFLSCASKHTTPPSQEVLESSLRQKNRRLTDKVETNERQALLYLNAKKAAKTNQACQSYRKLAIDQTFPLNLLAKIKSFEVCPLEKDSMEKWWSSHNKDFTGFLRKKYLEVSLKIAQKLKSYRYLALFSQELAPYKRLRKERETLLKQALKAAQKTKDDSLIAETKKALHRYSPRLNPKPENKDLYATARNFERHRQFTRARKIYRKIIHQKSRDLFEQIKAYYRYAMSYKLQRSRSKYVYHFGLMCSWLKKEIKKKYTNNQQILKKWYEKRIQYARALWTESRLEAGRNELFAILIEEPKDPNIRADIYWLLAHMSLEQKKKNETLAYLSQAKKIDDVSPKKRDRISWSLGWNYYLSKQYKKSIDTFQDAEEQTEDTFLQKKLQFWRAKAHLLKGETSEAHSLFKDLTAKDPFGYYGLVSQLEIGEQLEPLNLEEQQYIPEDNTLNWLISLKEYKIAEDYLKNIQKSFTDVDDIEELLPYYQLANWHEGGIFKFFKIEPEERNRVLNKFAHIAFPSPYKEQIIPVAKRYGLPPELIYAISRQESAFNPTIRSWADAFGLMQILPEKAKKLSKRAKVNYKSFHDLYDVQTNIALGSLLLKDLLKKFKGNFIGFVGSYNAGPGAVRKWLKTRHRKDPLEFIEMIPFEETKGYIKLVYRNYIIYQRLFGKKIQLKRNFFRRFR